ncbi:hypothetical protein Esti_003489 [Eimeria stiedai]
MKVLGRAGGPLLRRSLRRASLLLQQQRQGLLVLLLLAVAAGTYPAAAHLRFPVAEGTDVVALGDGLAVQRATAAPTAADPELERLVGDDRDSFSRKFRKQLKGLQQGQEGETAAAAAAAEEAGGEGEGGLEDFGPLSPLDAKPAADASLTKRKRKASTWNMRARQLRQTAHKLFLLVLAVLSAAAATQVIAAWKLREAQRFLTEEDELLSYQGNEQLFKEREVSTEEALLRIQGIDREERDQILRESPKR